MFIFSRHLPRRLYLLRVLVGLILSSESFADASCNSSTVTWSSTSNQITINAASGPVTCTIPEIVAVPEIPASALGLVANATYLLSANLLITNGARLDIHGPNVSELRLISTNSAPIQRIEIKAEWGTIDINSTKILSWDTAVNGPDTSDSNGRSFIRARSKLIRGVSRESTMNINNSEISYLGYNAAESYGVTWKVVGSGSDFDFLNVYGMVTNSHSHHNYMGFYSFGAQDLQILSSEFDHNVSYGIDPHDDSDNLLIDGNSSHDNGNHGIICSKRCDHIKVTNNRSFRNTGHGIMFHRLVVDSEMANNESFDNTDTGIILFDSHNNLVTDNLVYGNLRGVRLSVGSRSNIFEHNEVRNNQRGIYFYMGSDAPSPGDDGRPRNNIFRNNNIHDNSEYAISSFDAETNVFENNTFVNNVRNIVFNNVRSGKANILANNIFIPDMQAIESNGTKTYPTSVLIKSNQNFKISVNTLGKATIEDANGRIFDLEETGEVFKVTNTGSSYTATNSAIAGSSQVLVRNFWVKTLPISTLSVRIKLLLWETGAGLTKEWQATGSTGQSVSFKVGDLAAKKIYRIVENGSVIGTQVSDSQGVVTFTRILPSSNAITYSIRL